MYKKKFILKWSKILFKIGPFWIVSKCSLKLNTGQTHFESFEVEIEIKWMKWMIHKELYLLLYFSFYFNNILRYVFLPADIIYTRYHHCFFFKKKRKKNCLSNKVSRRPIHVELLVLRQSITSYTSNSTTTPTIKNLQNYE